MTPNSLIKSSSRAGRFKKKLVSQEQLNFEAPVLEARLTPVLDLLKQGEISEAEFTAISLISALSLRNPGSWPGARRPSLGLPHKLNFPLAKLPLSFEPNVERRLQGIDSVGNLLNNFALKSTPLAVNRALLKWSEEDYKLRLFFHIPSPAEVLSQQVQGERCVTVLTKANEFRRFVLGERDSVSFTMHDLIHADHFYHDNAAFEGQVDFYRFLSFCYNQGHFEELSSNKEFSDEFDYLISDMNAYAIHLLKCLKSALIHYHPESHEFFSSWLNGLNPAEDEAHAFLALNTPHYNPIHSDFILLQFLKRFKL